MGWFGRAQRPAQNEALESVVGPTSTLTGTLRSDGGVRVDGVFGGIIEVAGNVVIGRDGRVTGDITARNVTVGGLVQGNIDGTGQLQILATGRVIGDISVSSVMIDEGGMFQGSSRLRGFDQPALPAPEDADAATGAAAASSVGAPVPSGGVAGSEQLDMNQENLVEVTARQVEQPAPAARGSALPADGAQQTPPASRPARRTAAAASAAVAPDAAVRTFDDGLDIDLGRMDIEPIIPDMGADADEGRPAAPPPTTKRDRTSRRTGKR